MYKRQVQGLTEFLPISSSGHLILVPYLFGWDDPFLTSLAFSVVLHGGTLAALLVYFRDDWRRLIPAGFATIRDRSFNGDPDRRLAWLIAAATVPAWSTTENASDSMNGSSHPNRYGTRSRCPDDEIGRNSVSPWTIPMTSAWNACSMSYSERQPVR